VPDIGESFGIEKRFYGFLRLSFVVGSLYRILFRARARRSPQAKEPVAKKQDKLHVA